MAAPVRKGEELEVRIDSLAYGGNGVGRLDGFVVFVRGGLPGDLVRARVTKVKRGFAEATRVDVLEPGPGSCRGAVPRTSASAAAAASRTTPTSASSRRRRRRCATRSSASAASSSRRSSRSCPRESQFGYRNKLEYSFARTATALVLGFHRAGRWDEVHRRGGVPAHDRARQRDPRGGQGVGARGGSRAVRPGRRRRVPPPPRRPGGPQHGAGARRCSSPLRASGSTPTSSIETVRRFPEVRSIHWADQRPPAEVTNLPTRLLWGDAWIEEELLGLRFRVRPNAFLQTNTEMAETLYALARDAAGLTGSEVVYDLYCGTGTIGLALAAARGVGLGRRDLRGVGRVRDRERGG